MAGPGGGMAFAHLERKVNHVSESLMEWKRTCPLYSLPVNWKNDMMREDFWNDYFNKKRNGDQSGR